MAGLLGLGGLSAIPVEIVADKSRNEPFPVHRTSRWRERWIECAAPAGSGCHQLCVTPVLVTLPSGQVIGETKQQSCFPSRSHDGRWPGREISAGVGLFISAPPCPTHRHGREGGHPRHVSMRATYRINKSLLQFTNFIASASSTAGHMDGRLRGHDGVGLLFRAPRML